MLGFLLFTCVLAVVLWQMRGLELPLKTIIAGVCFMTVAPYLFGILTGCNI